MLCCAELHLEGDFKKTKLKLTWLAQSKECPALELQASAAAVVQRARAIARTEVLPLLTVPSMIPCSPPLPLFRSTLATW